MTTEPKRDYGFIPIYTPEDKAKYGPELVTDEYWNVERSSWVAVPCPDTPFCEENTYRRKISPGPNFEIVPLDGIVQKGDQYYHANAGTWYDATLTGKTVSEVIGGGGAILAYRRPLPKPVEQGAWVSVKERLPELNKPIYVGCDGRVDSYYGGVGSEKWLTGSDWTHWQYWIRPEPPQPPRPAAEVAFQSYWYQDKRSEQIKRATYEEAKAIFLAGWDATKSNKGEL